MFDYGWLQDAVFEEGQMIREVSHEFIFVSGIIIGLVSQTIIQWVYWMFLHQSWVPDRKKKGKRSK